MPANASVMMSSGHDATDIYSPLQAFCILLVWAAVLFTAAWFSIKRRDV
jgi:ABC-2 type transport system permease protein